MQSLTDVAPPFVEMAHRIVWATVATIGPTGAPRTRVLHPLWEWDGRTLTGWIATSPLSPKRRDLDHDPRLSLTYWTPDHDTCTADCGATWILDPEAKGALWDRFADAPEPVGYDPSLIPQWTSPDVDEFGGLRLEPTSLRVMPGSLMTQGKGTLLSWRAT